MSWREREFYTFIKKKGKQNKMEESYNFCTVSIAPDGLSLESLNELKELVVDLIDRNFKTIVLNLEKIKKVNKDAIESLLTIQKIAMFNNVAIKIYKLQPNVKKTILQARLDKILEICESEEIKHLKNIHQNISSRA